MKKVFFWTVLLAFFFGLVALSDYVCRRYYERITPESGRVAVEVLRGLRDYGAVKNFLPHPYVYYVNRPGQSAFGKVQFNSMGFRGAQEYSQVPGEDTLRLLMMGGSTTASYPYVKDPEDTWVAMTGSLLQEMKGRRVESINAGLNAATSADLLAHYVFRNRYLKPRIVVLHVGGNDALPMQFRDYNPEYTHYARGWSNTSLASRPRERSWLRSGIVRTLYAWWLKDISLDAEMGRESLRRQAPDVSLENARLNEPTGFRRNLEFLVQTIRDDGAVPVLFPFVYAPEERFRNAGRYGKFYDSLTLSYEKNYRVIREVAETYGVHLAELPADALGPEHFVDFCHLNEEGEEIVARFLAGELALLIKGL
jgi:lysophospholipase L1-like esterase